MKTAHDLVVAARARIRELDPAQAQAALPAVDLVLDVREPDEYAVGHLPGAINVPRGLLEFRLSAAEALQRRDLKVLIYCKSGGRAALGACTMQDMGYLDVWSIAGGIDTWTAAGGAVVQPAPLRFD
ncbi:rhodanese-related sulfurtransferase [Sphaerotilus hippei]|uniref:Rhodanese-related sulfurtransferase n=1 Tax=Sphaerotilus hippei TaxID=744406 RepID=A0A318GVW5_9BURK|nr:rhodanese-like domain-containing protein [Sphaerotilus hippei]PXW92348.1 rhodanese-related sulfurtransferase [Sphaerotilus hippei]